MSRAFESKETTCYYGHGLAIESVPAINSSELYDLRQENEQLKEQLHYQQQLLGIWQRQPCTTCQTQKITAIGTSSSGANSNSSRLSRSNSRSCSSTTAADAAADTSNTIAVHGCLDKAFRQQQVLIAQLQRQVMVMEIELSSREQLVLEADAVLAECSRKLSALLVSQDALLAPDPGVSSTNRATAKSTATARSVASISQRPASRPRLTPLVAAESGVSNNSAAPIAAKQVLEQAQVLFVWCKSSAARISRARAEAAARCRAARNSSLAANRAVCNQNSSHSSSTKWEGEQAGPSTLQQLQLQYAPVGGNRFMKQGASLAVSHILAGHGRQALNVAVLHQLVPQLAGLAHSLANLSVQLRSMILPVMPWVAAAAGEQLTNSTAVIAESAAAAVGLLVEACSVLPAVAGALSVPAAAAARNRRVKEAAAVREAGMWGDAGGHAGNTTATEQLSADAAAQEFMQLHTEDVKLFALIAGLAAVNTLETKGSSKVAKAACSSSASSFVDAGGNTITSASKQCMQQQRMMGADTLLQQLRQRWHVMWFKKQVLEQQLRFVAKCSSEQAKLVSRLTHDVAAAVTEAADGVEQKDGLQQRREDAQQLVQKLMRAMLLLQQRPGAVAAAGSALKALVGLLTQHAEVLQDIPKLLHCSSGPVVKAAALAAVTAVFQGFGSEVHGAQQLTDRFCKQAKRASAESMHHLEA